MLTVLKYPPKPCKEAKKSGPNIDKISPPPQQAKTEKHAGITPARAGAPELQLHE